MIRELRSIDMTGACPCAVQDLCKDTGCIVDQAADVIEILQAECDALADSIKQMARIMLGNAEPVPEDTGDDSE